MPVAQQTTVNSVPTTAPIARRPSAFGDEDDLIRLAAEGLLRSCNHGSVRDVRIIVEDRVVMLFGTLASYHLKQVIQTEVMNLELVARVENHCEVDRLGSR